jgi:hypothetical protein
VCAWLEHRFEAAIMLRLEWKIAGTLNLFARSRIRTVLEGPIYAG